MTYYEDLSSCDYFGRVEGRLLAVGWLDRAHGFAKGPRTRPFFETLSKLTAVAWQPFATAGRHACDFCIFTGGPGEVRVADISVVLGATNVFVPGADAVYVAPSLVLHYIDAHEYSPPDEFRRAVEACPPMRSMTYLKALREQGVHRLASKPTDASF
jgi:hypothetical protein